MLFDMQTNVAGDTSFRRMSVRRVVNESKRIITRLTRPVFFTANDSETRLTLTRNITTELNRLGGISSLQVICDERNNSDADQNAGVLNIDVLMVPTNYVRVIYLKIYVTKNKIGVAEQEI
jgi:phage tail sheath protein FI